MLKKFAKFARMGITVLASACIFGGLSNTAQAIPFDQINQIYFFGDSLTDSGYNDLWYVEDPTTPLGKAPTFTTYGGYIWSQYLARDIKGFVLPVYNTGSRVPNPPDTITNNTTSCQSACPVTHTLTGIDYAAGGSTTNGPGNDLTYAPSLVQQVSNYLASAPQQLDPNNIYFIWAGANDLLILLNSGFPTELQLLVAANLAAINIANEVAALSARGAKRVVVLSLPNIGYTPLIGAYSAQFPTLPGMMKTISFTFNSFLNQQLGGVVKQYGTKILYFDVYDLLDNVIAATQAGQPYVEAGQSFMFTNYTTEACGFISPGNPVSAINCAYPSDGHIFADDLHPTDMAHQLLSLAVEQSILNWK